MTALVGAPGRSYRISISCSLAAAAGVDGAVTLRAGRLGNGWSGGPAGVRLMTLR
jgi:hypothetical protein